MNTSQPYIKHLFLKILFIKLKDYSSASQTGMAVIAGRESLGTAAQLPIRQRISNKVRNFIAYSLYTDTCYLEEIKRKSYTLHSLFNIPANI